MTARHLLVLALLAALAGCDGDGTTDAGALDAGGPDAGREPPPRVREELPTPGPLQAGIAQARIPAPLGVGTMGFAPTAAPPSPTPFANNFPGTIHAQGELTFRAVAISRGDRHEVIFVRMDTVGVFQQLREAVLDAIEARTGRDLDDALILAGNHTHSGPGRLLMTTGALEALGDSFFPEMYDAIVAVLADVVVAALDDLAPAELAVTMAETSDAHVDRRCENDSLPQLQESGELPLIAIRRGGQLDAIVASYAYHGTILGIDRLTLSGDMGAVVEQTVEGRFDRPVTFLFFNSWGADAAPASPSPPAGATGADLPGGFERMELLGGVVADTIVPALDALSFSSDVEVRARTYRVPLSRDAIGYADGEFNYPHGGAFCGIGQEGNCVDSTPREGLDGQCIRISPAERLPKQTMLSAGRVGALAFVTAPGEWGTALAHGVLDQVEARTGGDAMLIGYANDYTGYSLGREDWFQGGYEASGALWGPGQGDYLAARLAEAFLSFDDQWTEPPWWQPEPTAPFSGYTYDPYVPEGATDPGTIAVDVPAAVAATELVTFTVRGADPWLGDPVATLEREDGGVFVAVTRPNGRPVDSRGYDIWADLTPTPGYAEQARATEREFAWTFTMPASRRAATATSDLSGGTYRFVVRVPTAAGVLEVSTGAFTVN